MRSILNSQRAAAVPLRHRRRRPNLFPTNKLLFSTSSSVPVCNNCKICTDSKTVPLYGLHYTLHRFFEMGHHFFVCCRFCVRKLCTQFVRQYAHKYRVTKQKTKAQKMGIHSFSNIYNKGPPKRIKSLSTRNGLG